MSNKKTILILMVIISIVILLIAGLIAIYTYKGGEKNPVQVEQNNLYFVTKNEDTGYGICKTDGTVIIKPEFSQIARVEDSVYLKSQDDSYVFSLKDGKSVSLGGKESDINFVYDKDGKLLPYYILRYGQSEQDSIYRIYDTKGDRHDTKDFSNLNDAYKFLNAKEIFTPSAPSTTLLSIYNVITTLSYPTIEGKTQYIVTKKDNSNNDIQGLVDESGRIILDLTYSKLSPIVNSKNAIKAEKNDKTYIFLSSEKSFEVEPDFDLVTSNGYYLQKRGNIVNKVYNLSGDLVVDGIYNIDTDLILLNADSGISYLLVQDQKETYTLYNLNDNKKSDIQYSKPLLDYLKTYSNNSKNISFVYQKNGVNYTFDLNNLKEYKITGTSKIYSPFDLGVVYKLK